jgi:hypothetical protein
VNGTHPEDAVLQAPWETELNRPSDPLRAVVETGAAARRLHIEAVITLADRPFYRRSWGLSLGPS